MKPRELFTLVLSTAYVFVVSVLGAGLAGVWFGLARRAFYLGLYWVTTDGPVRTTWPLI